jgi:hypothetical protein
LQEQGISAIIFTEDKKMAVSGVDLYKTDMFDEFRAYEQLQ